ncbi:hybrid sensor histidine kinase/response regulator [Stakelama saccharophila]|uniref:histidine kinase n=1 Tax=Stakelama saccharophila TaxID=3075605 RepID=A0ABZ0B6Y4_9SPHN|nr:response regulator [Stakelama sp. W311]WNO52876.1 response regulator [Stakelama sp. W311]
MATLFASAFSDTPRRRAGVLWLPALCGVAVALALFFLVGEPAVAAGFAGAGLLIAAALFAWAALRRPAPVAVAQTDWSVAHVLAASAHEALAVTDRAGRLACANPAFEMLFGGFPAPPSLPLSGDGEALLHAASREAWRDGEAVRQVSLSDASRITAHLVRAGDDMLVWRFASTETIDLPAKAQAMLTGEFGDRIGGAGIMAAVLRPDGRVRAANSVLRARAMGDRDAEMEGRDFARFLVTDNRGFVRFEREGMNGNPIRVLHLPFADGEQSPMLVALLDEEQVNLPAPLPQSAGGHVRSLVSLIPFGIALVDRDGRFLHMNSAFCKSAGIDPDNPPLYPSDLVVREDKAPFADVIRRSANGAAYAADMPVRLKERPDEPVAVTLVGARGLGEAAVLVTFKDSGEESKLKRQVAQQTKMQAVGQLAGGVAHDFNNILTAIIGHCDLMLMRHAPGDSDYDDIQQVRANSHRAASLTRQLLAFSRQQTLRPQVLQLPDVISEVSNLLKRLLGETVELVVQHGRGLGPVRADPGQLEQVVVNLAVNARDAMLSKHPNGGGTLTIETVAVSSAEVRRLADDELPVGDYTALIISDTGTGIPQEALGKIFEPFYTTKEVGKGTGLGLSTVYGIIKQSGGYIFAESPAGGGARFSIFLPVHAAQMPGKAATPLSARPKKGDLWGSGTILLVEDEDMVRAVAERALTRQGYTVLTAENGEAALELMEENPELDLLISDVVMPGMDGPTMANRIRKRYPDMPILFMSGYAEEQLRNSIDIDNVAFLPKPFSVQQLAEAARDVLRAE